VAYTLRVWLWLECRDMEGWLCRDVEVPALPQLLPDKETCDFSLTGLYRTDADNWLRLRDGTNCYAETQPDEQLYEPCYDVAGGVWHVTISGHMHTARAWKQLLASYYTDWTASSRDGGPRPIPPKPPRTAPVTTPPKPAPHSGPAKAADRKPGVAKSGAHHTKEVAAVLRDKKIRMYGRGTMLERILRHLVTAEEYNKPGRVLRVGDLTGQTYESLAEAKGVGRSTLQPLVKAGLIPKRLDD
jgi:hypothetical protein